jgi:hypothetical protein
MELMPRGDEERYALRVRAAGSWTGESPPYLHAVSEPEFVRLKCEWLHRTMKMGSLVASCRIVAYFLADCLNWATMDSWMGHETLAGLVGVSEKTVQRSIFAMEGQVHLSVWRSLGSRHPLRYSPKYLETADTGVAKAGQGRPGEMDMGVHQSFLSNLPQSSLAGLPTVERPTPAPGQKFVSQGLSFKRAERGRHELQVAPLVGGIDVLYRLAAIHDDIVTRICEAHCRGELGARQIRAVKLAAKQCRFR